MITLEFADEQSVVQTRFATTELALLRAHLGADIGPVAAAARRALEVPLPQTLTGASQFTFLGTGWTCGLASEAALKLKEAAGMWTEAYPAMEFRHGPIAVTGPGSVVWLLSPAPAGLTEEIAAAGGRRAAGRRRPDGRAGRRPAAGGGRRPRPRPGSGPAAEPEPVGHPRSRSAGLSRRDTGRHAQSGA